ncbi:MAG: NosD domain-containing protein [Thermoproteota archaeon]|nr:NosD domain-containing protein [Thermoproteota archaeon]NLD64983.1 hypothetical protein [Thermoproteota archaeon]
MNKIRSISIAGGLIGIVILSMLLLAFETGVFNAWQIRNSPFYVGVEIGWEATVDDAKALIDHVKGFTNLLVIGSSSLRSDKLSLDRVCDYAYNAGLNIIVCWESALNSPNFGTMDNSYRPYEWVTSAKQKYGSHFLGAYYCDEPGGKVLDSENPLILPSYSDVANNFIENSQAKDFPTIHQVSSLLFTADYGLYWFDYKAGYDVVLAELGWNNSRSLQISQVRGAATVQNKDWGVIVTWTYDRPPYLQSGNQLYDDLVLSYNSGADYAVVFDASKRYSNSTLTEEHYEALNDFWTYIQNNPQNHGCLNADKAIVLPRDYGFGFRNVGDKVWGLSQSDNWTCVMYNDVSRLIDRYNSSIDIVYGDPEWKTVIEEKYDRVFCWPNDFMISSDFPVINLNNGLGYNTIQEAISSYATYSGDEILVKPGIYRENIVVTKPLELISQNKDTTIIHGVGNSALMIISDNVTVTGFTLENGGNLTSEEGGGLILENANNCLINWNNIKTSNYGVVLQNSAFNIFKNNLLIGNKFNFGVNSSTPQGYINDIDSTNTINGKPVYYWVNKDHQQVPLDAGYIALVNCTNITVESMCITNNFNGLLLAYSQNTKVTNNTFKENYVGIEIDGSLSSILKTNSIQNNLYNLWVSNGFYHDIDGSNRVDDKQVIYWINKEGKTVPSDAGYVALINCSGITAQRLKLSNNGQGILLYNTKNCTITQNNISSEANGIELYFSENIMLSENRVEENTKNGIKIDSADHNTFFRNTLISNAESGFYIYGASFNNIYLNKIASNTCGITLQGSQETNSTQNIITENLIASNNIFLVIKYGTALKNTLYHNNFIDNNIQLIDGGISPITFWSRPSDNPVNYWDNGQEGNYWSDYTGTDKNADGIGDIPCYVRNSDQDNFPLMKPH